MFNETPVTSVSLFCLAYSSYSELFSSVLSDLSGIASKGNLSTSLSNLECFDSSLFDKWKHFIITDLHLRGIEIEVNDKNFGDSVISWEQQRPNKVKDVEEIIENPFDWYVTNQDRIYRYNSHTCKIETLDVKEGNWIPSEMIVSEFIVRLDSNSLRRATYKDVVEIKQKHKSIAIQDPNDPINSYSSFAKLFS